MPVSLLLIIYLLFAFVAFDSFDFMPLLVCLITGSICGYVDYGRYFIDKGLSILTSTIATILFFSMFTPNLGFKVSLIIVTCFALSIGAIVNIIVHSVSSLEKREEESRQLNEGLTKSNEALQIERNSLHLSLNDVKKRETELRVSIKDNLKVMQNLNYKNSHLTKQNRDLEVNLKEISAEKKHREDKLSSLTKSTFLMENSLKQLTRSQEEIDNIKKDLMRKEQGLRQKIESLTVFKDKQDNSNATKQLEKQLRDIRNELKSNELEKSSNLLKLREAHQSIALQAKEKLSLENKIDEMRQQQQSLIKGSNQLKLEKEITQSKLNSVQNEINSQKTVNLENEKVIEQMSLTIKELKISDEFLKNWLDIETLLKNYAYPTSVATPAKLIEYSYDKEKIDLYLRENLHELRLKRNKRFHEVNTKITENDVIKSRDCLMELKDRLT
ncbi:hypothetical protein [Psychrobacter sp. M13]|uniref:hypothetical protein n=1 Tax=Psychrobacter sp. M13 TaxID=3067275 RepID=UPI00273B8177|nr:hypothetical protein [Psychrobacter sp. M13]WLP94395.1 hypothetical protein Q9G97_12580 [Psychrobacter sp. M13]